MPLRCEIKAYVRNHKNIFSEAYFFNKKNGESRRLKIKIRKGKRQYVRDILKGINTKFSRRAMSAKRIYRYKNY